MAQSRKYSPRKNEDPSLDSLHPYENWVWWHIPVIPALKGQTQQDPEICWPASLAEINEFWFQKVENDTGNTQHHVFLCMCLHAICTYRHTYTQYIYTRA